MKNTREDILLAALRLFARNGYEATSVSDIAAELNITKGALYKHYKSKRNIFDCIVERMAERDCESAQAHELPEGEISEMEDKYASAEPAALLEFSMERFDFWTQDEFASLFRRMLIIEQFRDGEMRRLYEAHIVTGPLEYVTDLLSAMGHDLPRSEALAFYSPMAFLYSVYDGGSEALAKELAREHFEITCRKILEI